MKTKQLWALLAAGILGSAMFAADSTPPPATPATTPDIAIEDLPPELRGVLSLGGERRFALSTPGGTQSGWITLGGEFNGWEAVEFREKEEVLVVRKEGVTVEAALVATQIVATNPDARATVAQAEELMRQMHFEEMFAKVIEQQKQMAVSMTRQLVAQDKNAAASADDVAEFQRKMMDALWAEMNPEEMGKEMARAYAEVFTPAELRGMAEFYSTPAGQASIDKAPELQQRLMESMMPRMLAAMPKIQQMGREFGEQQRLKQQQAGQQNATPSDAAGHAPEPPATP